MTTPHYQNQKYHVHIRALTTGPRDSKFRRGVDGVSGGKVYRFFTLLISNVKVRSVT